MKKVIRGAASRFGVAGELLGFFWRQKLWWLIPMVATLLVLALLVSFAEVSGIAPFIYPLF